MRQLALILIASGIAFAQVPDPGYGSAPPLNAESARGLIDRTRGDLKQAADFERHHGGKEVERYEIAARHLSDFDRELTRGHFDPGKLDTAIDDVKYVVEHNTFGPNERDALRADLENLQLTREHHSGQ